MNAKIVTRVLREIEETVALIDYLLAQGVDFESLCACLSLECRECRSNDQNFFSEKKVREAVAWNKNNL